MNWGDYKKWLLENILYQEKEQNKYTLLLFAQEKYKLIGGKELEESLNDFLASADRKYGDITYHALREWKEGESWEELFPERCEVLLGSRKKKTPPSEKAWDDLTKLYNYWGTEKEREAKLREEAEKLRAEVSQKGKEIVTSLVSEISKENNFLVRYQNWLTEYELLGQETQQNLKEHKKEIEKDQTFLLNGTERQTKKKQWWTKKIEEIEEMIATLESQLRLSENQNSGNLRIFLISLSTSVITGIIVYLISGRSNPSRREY